MPNILSGIHSLVQHLEHLEATPGDYRPECCLHCGKAGVWCHGAYTRKADRDNPTHSSLNPIRIPRFFCRHCQRTCSTLPECVPPRRWYLWTIQQAVLWLLCTGHSLAQVSAQVSPCESTLWRWWRRWQGRFAVHAWHLRNRFGDLGRASGDVRSFWRACLAQQSLSSAMVLLHGAGVVIP